ncbi:MAG: glycosyltransferase [Butyrivibrio sp.]|nr:glycosyltransferase [Butyrivibrio sp.]
MDIAITIFVYNRISTLTKMLESLRHCRGLEKHDIFFFSDGYKDKTDAIKVGRVREIIHSFLDNELKKKGTIIERTENLGLARSVISGVGEVLEQYDAIICIEDDLIFSEDFLEYMDSALEKFKDDNRVWAISGYCQKLNCLDDINANSFISYRSSSWGWGSWKERWNNVDWDVTDYAKFEKSSELRKSFGKWGKDMPYLLDLQMRKVIDSWAIRWCYSQWKKNMFTVFPTETRVKNIGEANEATHTKKLGKQQFLAKDHKKIEKYDLLLDERIMDEFSKYCHVSVWKVKIKCFLADYLNIYLR